MKKEFVSYEQALALKDIGFDKPCLASYYYAAKNIELGEWMNHGQYTFLAPLKQQLFRWFRDKHNLFGCIDLQCCEPAHWFFRIDDIIKNDYLYHSEDENLRIESFEEAEDACIDKLIEIVKQINYDTK